MSRTTHIKYGALEAPAVYTLFFFFSFILFNIVFLGVRRETGESVLCARRRADVFWAQPMRTPAIDVPGFDRRWTLANYCDENGSRLD